MAKISEDEVRRLVENIRMGLGEDAEINSWIEQIRESVPNREVIKAIMAGPDATIDDIMKNLYTTNVIQL